MYLKNYFSIFIYLLSAAIGLNFFLKYQKNNNVEDSIFYQKLYKIGYYKEKFNPYAKTSLLEVHPTNYFSLSLDPKTRKSINNKVLSLNNNGFRLNPYNSQSKSKKKCILFLGSSAGFGVGSSSDKLTLPAIINEKLGSDYKVYNLSIPSWNSRQELISLLNFLDYEEFTQCLTIDTISLTGTTDLIALEESKKSPIYKEIHLRKNLYNSSQYFPKLEKLVKTGKKTKKDLRFNLKMASNKLIKLLFGDLIEFANFNKKPKNKKNKDIKIIKNNYQENYYLRGQLNSFIKAQKTINSFTKNLGGNHLVVLQPNLNNTKKNESNWSNKNKLLTNLIQNESCLNILDMRTFFNHKQAKYNFKDELVTLSLEDSINLKLFKKEDLNKHFFYDNSHLTDLGNEILATKIHNKYLKDKIQTQCSFLKNLE